jgi:hypothetical protein
MLADFRFRARHITTSQWGSQRPRQVGSASVPPAIQFLRGSVEDILKEIHPGSNLPLLF